MNGRVFREALRQAGQTTGILAAGAGLFTYLVLFSSKSFLSEGSGFSGFFSNPPKAIQAFLGGSVNLLTPPGWVAAALTHPVMYALMTAAGVGIAAGSVATEVERGTIDLVLGRPVGRGPYLVAKAAAAVAAVTVVEAGALVGALVARATIDPLGRVRTARILGAFASSRLLFAAIALVAVMVSSRSSLRGRALGLAVGFVVGSFFLNFIALLVNGLAGLRYVSVFHYYPPTRILSGTVPGGDLAVLAAVGVAALGAALWWFARRDLTR